MMQMKDMVRRLERLGDLKREVNELSQRIAELELMAQGGSGRITGLPRGSRTSDRVARAAACIADLRDRMEDRRVDCLEELGRLYALIDDIPDSRLRQIFSARYIDGLSWQAVATRIDEFDEQVPRRAHNKYLQTYIASKFDENDESKVL